MNNKILVVGGGRMGSAIINGWLKEGVSARNIYVLDRNEEILESFLSKGVNVFSTAEDIPNCSFGVFLLALKPQVIMEYVPNLDHLVSPETCVISVAAGVTVSTLKSLLPSSSLIVRVMPNTPSMIGKGVVVAFSDNKTQLVEQVENLFHALGDFYWVDNEYLMHSVTAVSGSGPAYLFYFAECFIDSAKVLGIPANLAEKLALSTIVGAASLIDIGDESVVTLREHVTSPNGTTQAGLEKLMTGEIFRSRITACCEAAKQRSIELS